MSCCEPDDQEVSSEIDSFRRDLGEGGNNPLNEAARRSLNQIAEALGVTAALLKGDGAARRSNSGEATTLLEASNLLQDFIRISDPETRLLCLEFVAAAAASRSDGRS